MHQPTSIKTLCAATLLLAAASAFAGNQSPADADAATAARLSESASYSQGIPIGKSDGLTAEPNRGQTAKLLPEKLEAAASTRPAGIKAKASGAAKYGAMFSKDITMAGSEQYYAMELTTNGGKDSVHNVYGLGTAIAVNINQIAGTFRIPAQKIYTHSSYGDVFICPLTVSGSSVTFDPNGSIDGTIDQNGNVKLPAWAVMITSGANAGRAFATFASSSWFASNATLKITQTDGNAINAYSYVEQSADNEIIIYNFAATGQAAKGIITSSGQVKVAPQFMASLPQYGDFYCYPADWANNKINMTSPVVGVATPKILSFRDWVLALVRTGSPVALKVKSSVITLTDDEITLPDPVAGFSGAGSQASPYLIKSAADLLALSQRVGAGESFKDKYLALDADIDFGASGLAFSPIGDAINQFAGHFDGKGHTISNLRLNAMGSGHAGLFGYTSTESTIKNLNLKSIKFSGKGHYLGGIAGTTYGLIDGCSVEGSISGESLYAGGIAGSSWAPVRNCRFNGSMTTIAIAGGIVGADYNEISNCHADANLTITGALDSYYHDIAGIAGVATPGKDMEQIISDCSFTGTLTDTKGYGYIAGIVSKTLKAKVVRCANTGAISGLRTNPDNDVYAGGIVAWSSESSIADCLNAGTIVKTGSTQGNGGIVGYLSIGYQIMHNPPIPTGLSTITNCYNSGQIVTSYSATRKGIWGNTYFKEEVPDPLAGTITNCYNDFQANGLRYADYDMPTSTLTSGSLPQGFSAGAWKVEAGRYPVLKSMPAEVAALAAANLLLADGETVNKVKRDMKINSESSVSWRLHNGTEFAQETTGLQINGSDIRLKDTYSTEIVQAYIDDTHAKLYRLSVIPNLFVGEGTVEIPYQIRNAQDFMNLDRAVSHYGQPHAGDYFLMTNDIDFAGNTEFQGVGLNGSTGFGGTFDGGGHTVKNLKIHAAAFDGNGQALNTGLRYGGLFSKLMAEGTVKNVTTADCDFLFHEYGGAIVGSCVGRVENCRNYSDVKGVSHFIGGIVGQLVGGVVSRCYNSGSVIAGGYGAAGIVAENNGRIEYCQNDGFVASQRFSNLWPKLNHYRAGGIAGLSRGEIEGCVNQGHVKCLQQVGGIAGENTKSGGKFTGNITNCISTGPVECTGNYDTRGSLVGKIGAYESIAGNAFDASVLTDGSIANNSHVGVGAFDTETITSGKPLGLPADSLFLYQPGHYPVLKEFAAERASAAMSAAFPKFAGKATRLNIGSQLELSQADGLKWSLLKGEHLAIAGSKISATVPDTLKFATDTLRAEIDAKYVKLYPIQSLRKIFTGEGTAEAPYLIRNNEEMLLLSEMVEEAAANYSGEYFRLAADLTFGAGEYRPVARGVRSFNGDFNGDNHTIEFRLNDTDDRTGANLALFGTVGIAGRIHALNVKPTIFGASNAAGVVSNLYGSIENCVNLGSVTTSKNYAAGIAANAFGGASIANSRNNGTVSSGGSYGAGIASVVKENASVSNCSNTGAVSSGSSTTGGIVGRLGGALSGSSNSGKITSKSYIGGVVGILDVKGTITDCSNSADIESTGGGYAAGIVGNSTSKSTSASIRRCINTGAISGKQFAAGIVTVLSSGISLDSCSNSGNIVSAGNAAGGIAAKIEGAEGFATQVANCFNTGDVKGAGNYIGGLIGQIGSNSSVADSYNTGSVSNIKTGTTKVYLTGGIAGICSGSLTRSWSSGNVSGDGYGNGALVGYISGGEVSKCFATGNVTAGNQDAPAGYGAAGGLCGYIGSSGSLTDCYSTGNVSAPDGVGGICATVFSGAKIRNCYTISKVTATAADAATVSNVLSYANDKTTDANVTMTNVCYLAGVNDKASAPDSRAKALTRNELFDANMGANFDSHTAAWPTLKVFADNPVAHLNAVSYRFEKASDSEQALTGTLTIEPFDDIVWTCSPQMTILGSTVSTDATGAGWIQAALADGSASRRFDFNITEASGVDNVGFDGKPVKSVEFFSPDGLRILNPQPGQVCIRRTIFTDGTSEVSRIIFR